MSDRKSYQLYRTNPALGGDFKIDIFTKVPNRSNHNNNNDKDTLDIRYVGASMINSEYSGYCDNKNEKDYLQGKIHNIIKIKKDKIFGDYGNKIFLPDYNNGNIFTDKNYITGTYRINDYKGSNFGNTHCSTISLYLDNLTEDFIENLSVILKFSTSGNEIIRKVINIGKNPLIFDYLKTRIITNSEKNGVYIDHQNRLCRVLGYDIEKSIIVEKESSELYERMFSTQRPHLELIDILTSFFSDNLIILPQLVTFGIYFDLNKLVGGLGSLSQYSEYEVSTEVFSAFKKQNGEEIKETLRKKDFFTNFQYIPSYVLSKEGNLNKKYKLRAPNLLDIKKDYNEYTQLRDQNTIYNQKLVHWKWSDYDNMIFNHDPDFGNYKLKKDIHKVLDNLLEEFKKGIPLEILKKLSEKEIEDLFKKYLLENPDKIFDKGDKGKYGPNTGQNIDQYDKETDNIQWAGKVLLGSMNETFEVLGNPNKYITEGYFKLISGDNRKKDSKKIYLLLQTTPDTPTFLMNYKTNPHTNSLINELSLIPYEIIEAQRKNPGSYRKPHGYNDLIPKLYLKKDINSNSEYYIMYDPTITEPNSDKNKLDFKNLGYQTHLPHYLTQGKLLKFLKEITNEIDNFNKKINEGKYDDITDKEKHYKSWLISVNKNAGIKDNNNSNNNINIYDPLSKRGLLYRCFFNNPNIRLDYWVDFDDTLKGNLGSEDRIKYKLAEYFDNYVFLDRPGGNIVPLLIDIDVKNYKFINYIYFHNPNINKDTGNKLKIQQSEKYKESPLPLGSFEYWYDYYTQKKHIDMDILSINSNQGHSILNGIPGNNPNRNTEVCWFDKSIVIPLPKTVRYDNISKDNIDKIEMDNLSYYTTKIYHSGITETSGLYDIIRELK